MQNKIASILFGNQYPSQQQKRFQMHDLAFNNLLGNFFPGFFQSKYRAVDERRTDL